MVRSMMGFTSMPLSFWGYTLEIACIILNKVLSKSIEKTPYEIWIGRKPTLSYFKVCGCSTYVKCSQTDKLGLRSYKCYFIRYPKKIRGYYFYHPIEQKVFVGLKATFLEKKCLGEGFVAAKVELNKAQQVEDLTQFSEPTELDLIR